MAAAAEAAMAAATSGSTGSYCRGQMPRVDDEQKGAKRKKKRQEIEEQKKKHFLPFFFPGNGVGLRLVAARLSFAATTNRSPSRRNVATSRRCDSRRAAKKKFRRRFVFLGRGRSQLTRRLGAKKRLCRQLLGPFGGFGGPETRQRRGANKKENFPTHFWNT